MTTTHAVGLTWNVLVVPPIPIVTDDLPPGQKQRTWSPIAATLISGQHDAVLVDPLLTIEQGRALADWVAVTGKNLTTVYVTHGHGDHWFGLGAIRDRFPHVRAIATPAVVEHMRRQGSPESIRGFWQPRFPGQIPEGVGVAEPMESLSFELEGHELVAVEVGHTDTDDTTVLHVPDAGLVVAGDVAYNDVHLYLAESSPQGRKDWIAGLDAVESVNPRAVVAGHKREDNDDDPAVIEQTRQYIRDFTQIADTTTTARELYDQVLALYPDRVNPGALWSSSRALKP